MRYWWVNHKQTFKKEFDGGYIWSPTKNKNGSFNQTYLNLTLAKVGDIVFSYADTLIKAIGVVKLSYRNADVPIEFGDVGNQWHKDGYLVQIDWTKLDYPFKPKDHITWIKNLLPKKYSPIQQTGDGNQGVYLGEIDAVLAEKLIELINLNNSYVKPTVEEIEDAVEGDEEQRKIEEANISPTEKEQLIKARLGQGVFKRELAKIENGCRVTGVKNISFLTASHIKPWAKSENHEKLDGNNGLLLSPHVDRLFDQGHISFSKVGEILVADELVGEVIRTWGITIKNVGEFNSRQKAFIDYHNNNRFKG